MFNLVIHTLLDREANRQNLRNLDGNKEEQNSGANEDYV